MSYELHDACKVMPEMAAHEFDALKESIAAGWDSRYPVLLFEGKILDGRHRYKAAIEVGVQPTFAEWDGARHDGNPFRFVWQIHDARRHWQSQEQRHACWTLCAISMAKWQQEAERIRDEANRKRAESAKGNQNAAKEKPENSGCTVSAPTDSREKESRKSRTKKAESSGTNRGAVQRTEKIRKLSDDLGMPEVFTDMAAGKIKAHAALKMLEEEKRRRELQRPAAIALPTGIHHGDFRELADQIPDNSVELVFTDPPYDGESAALFEDAARVAARILKPGGSLIAYSGQKYLPQVYAGMGKHLTYWWTLACVHQGGNQLLQRLGVRCGWKPLVWYVKGGRGDVQNVIVDTISGDREKFAHEWQQSQAEAEHLIRELCSPDGLVVDFFLGGGTTAAACAAVGRRFIGFEINAASIEKAAKRLAA